LPSGNLLITGGVDYDQCGNPYKETLLNNSILYNPSNDSWSTDRELNSIEGGHSTVLLPDGNVLAISGQIAEIYNSQNQNWTAISGPTSVTGENPILLADGRVLLVNNNKAEIFDPSNRNWHTAPSPNLITGGVPVLLSDKRILYTQNSISEIFDPQIENWVFGGNFNDHREEHSATLLHDGRVLMAGGIGTLGYELDAISSAELYDPITGVWSDTGSLQYPRAEHKASLLQDGRVIVYGGFARNSQNEPMAITIPEIYDPVTETWSHLDSGNLHYNSTLTELTNGEMLSVGGLTFPCIARVRSEKTVRVVNNIRNTYVQMDQKPIIQNISNKAEIGKRISITGSGFRTSTGVLPIIKLMHVQNRKIETLQHDPSYPFSNTNLTSLPLLNFPDGHALVTVYVNGIPSESKIILVDRPPAVTSIERYYTSPTNRAYVYFKVNFSEYVTGVDASDFTLTETGNLSGSSIFSVGSIYSGNNNEHYCWVRVDNYSGTGSLSLNVADNDTIRDYLNTPL